MTNRTRRSARGLLLLSLLLSLLLGLAGLVAGSASAQSNGDDPSFAMPGWLEAAGLSGKGVFRSGSRGKFLEDYNLQSGADATLRVARDFEDGSHFGLRGFGQSGEKQGYLVSEYGSASGSGAFDLTLDLQAWTEYYNHRNGEARPNSFPFTNNGRSFYGDGIPSTDWLTVGGDFDVSLGSVFRDVTGEFHYRDVNGDQTTLKGGSVDGTAVPGSGPGSVDFGFPGRKHVDYDAYTARIGASSGLGGVNWQTNVVYEYQDNQSKQTEPNFDAASPNGIDEVDRFDEDSELSLVRVDLSGGRNLSSDLYVFGAGFFSFERSDPEPDQFVATGGQVFQTRRTTSSKVTRFTPALSFGAVYHPTPKMVVSADTSLRGTIQSADLDEDRDESSLLTGDFGSVGNHVDRDTVVSTTRISSDWKLAPRLTLRGEARYQYRYEDVDSRQDTVFVQIEPSEREKYKSDQHRLKLGPSIRYRMRKGRSLQAGYQFSYTDVDQDVDRLQNQFILGDYDSMKHRAYLKASGRIFKKLRGELRAQYVYEKRDMDAPSVQPVIVASAGNGKVETYRWNISPVLYYTPNRNWNVFGNYSIGWLKLEPDSGSTFEYKVLTQSLSSGVSYRASERWSATASYTAYLNDDDVENLGHNAALIGDFRINDNWSVNGGYRFLSYDLDGSGVDDYDTSIVTLGVTGRF